MIRQDPPGELGVVIPRRARERGHANLGWLDAYYTFSFASYNDPAWRGFRSLRALNEQWLAPRSGFGEHAHANVEIVTLVLEGTLEQRDRSGKTLLTAGTVQRLTAGYGISHDEFNPSWRERVHYVELWIEPGRADLAPSLEKRSLPSGDDRGGLHVFGAPEDGSDVLRIHQNVATLFGRFAEGERVTRAMVRGCYAWVQILTGVVTVNGWILEAGDGAAICAGGQVDLVAAGPAELLYLELS
jgi:redox-sensitive bicupin YhaK (pirin superfamily)